MISDTEFTAEEKAELAALNGELTSRRLALADLSMAQAQLDMRKATAVKAVEDAEKRLNERVELAFRVSGVDLTTDKWIYKVDTTTQNITKVERVAGLKAVG